VTDRLHQWRFATHDPAHDHLWAAIHEGKKGRVKFLNASGRKAMK
jgi:hypothetical protein